MSWLSIFAFSIFSSTVSPLFGIGGGLLNVPFLTYFEGASFVSATTASLLAGFFLSLSASAYSIRNRKADVGVALRLAPLLVLGSLLSAYVPLHEKCLYLIFALFALLVSYIMLFQAKLEVKIAHPVLRQLLLFIIGMLSGLLGIGGGVVLVPFLMFIHKLGIKEAVATSSVIVVFVMLSGFASHFLHGDFDPGISIPLAIPALFMGYLGAYLMVERIRSGNLRKAFAVFLVFIAVSMLAKAL